MAHRAVTRYLIVDDSGPFLAAARAKLEREGAIVVGDATNSAEAVRLAHELTPDVILVDIDLGDDNGFDLADRLAAADAAPVVLTSASPEDDFVELIAASPAVGFLCKSVLSADAVRVLLGRGNDSAE